MTASSEALHRAVQQGLSTLAQRVVATKPKLPTLESPEALAAATAGVFAQVLTLGCRELVSEWYTRQFNRTYPECVAFRDRLPRLFPSREALDALPFGPTQAMTRVVDLAFELGGASGQSEGPRSAWEWLLVAYEQALQLVPRVEGQALVLEPGSANRPHARRASGSYYTPTGLVEMVLDAALEPMVQQAYHAPHPEQSLLELTVLDPACGTGRFLVAAAHRLTRHLVRVRGVSPEQHSDDYQSAFCLVVKHCIHGVDLSPNAVGFCRLSLWLDAGASSLADSFASGIRHGHALVGAPAGFESGVPDSAWEPTSDDHKATARALRRRHRAARRDAGSSVPLTPSLQRRFLADVWCGSYFWPKLQNEWFQSAPTHDRWLEWVSQHSHPEPQLVAQVRGLAEQHAFFHWTLEYPEVFEHGGFAVVIGNPPWIAHAGRAAQRLSARMKHYYACNYSAFAHYPATHSLFVSLAAQLLREGGRLGLIVPASMSELDGYRAARAAHDQWCDVVDELQDLGEGQFVGVTQPCMALVSRRVVGGRAGAHGAPWPLKRPDLDDVARGLLMRLGQLPTLPSELFGERGIQTDSALRDHFLSCDRPQGRFTVPLREGADVREFYLAPPRWHVDADALGSRLRTAEEYQRVRALVRQTARFPIAALSDGQAFRNSLLAVYDAPGWSALMLVGLLNSSLVRWLHYARFRDARQPVMPQVKIGHLRAIPDLPPMAQGWQAQLTELAGRIQHSGETVRNSLRVPLDEFIFDAYQLSEGERGLIRGWHRAFES